MKRCVALLISLAVIICMLFGMSTFSFAYQFTDIERTPLGSDSVYYEFDAATKTLTIGGNGAVPNMTNTSSGSTAQPWFSWRADGSISRVVVEEGITSLGNYCFYGMSVADIELPSTITRLGSYALASNNKLEHINIENVSTISNNAFASCTKLQDIFIPSSASYIGTDAFDNCKLLETVEFESMAMEISISRSAFLRCPALERIDIPRYATLGAYAVGYKSESKGSVYENFTMGVYSDSSAYTFAKNYFLNYELLTNMVIREGNELECRYYINLNENNEIIDQNINEAITYYFTPVSSAQYKFYSTGEVDVDCTLSSLDGEIIEISTDNSSDDLNFSFDLLLSAGETYCFTVNSVNSTGDYVLHLLPVGLEDISVNWDISLSAAYVPDGQLDVAELIRNMSVDFIYSSGYVYHMPFEEGASHLSMVLHYAGALGDRVTCGDNYDYITVGDRRFDFNINIIHSYIANVHEATLKEEGFTVYVCCLCEDAYTTDITDRLSTDVYGYLRALAEPNGEAIEGSFIPDAYIYNNEGKQVGKINDDGYFYVMYAYDYLTFATLNGNERRIEIEHGKYDLGDITLVIWDFNNDGYINAKDFAVFSSEYGEYDEDDIIMKSYDLNNNGYIDYGDWEYAQSFLSYGKLNESVYDN